MKIVLDIKDSKADFFMELIKNFNFIKTETLVPSQEKFLHELKKAAIDVSLAKKGKIKLQSGKDFLDEL